MKRRAELAGHLEVTVRTLSNWARLDGDAPRRQGRPPHTEEVRGRARRKVQTELERQGFTAGWRPIARALKGQAPTRLVQELVSELKRENRIRKQEEIEEARVSLTVQGRDIIWTQDGAHLGRQPTRLGQVGPGDGVEMQLLRDRASLRSPGFLVGPPADSDEVISLLKATGKKRGALPLVWQTDGASINCADKVEKFLGKNLVIHLVNEPGQPTDNAAAERAVGEVKAEAGLGKGIVVTSYADAASLVLAAVSRLDGHRLRASRGYLTACELDETLPRADNIDRVRFYFVARERMQSAASRHKDKVEKRRAEREEAFRTLEGFGLVKRTRGGLPYRPSREETIS